MNIESVKQQANSTFKATIDGKEWSGIHAQSKHWNHIQKWIDDGGEVEPEFTAGELAAQDLVTEQAWVVAELAQADKEIFILEDGDPRGKADIPAWRTYRKALRDHTTGERPARPL